MGREEAARGATRAGPRRGRGRRSVERLPAPLRAAVSSSSASGRLERVRGALGRAYEIYEATGAGDTPSVFENYAEALVGTGDLERAREVVDLYERRARTARKALALAPAMRCRGLVAEAEGDLAAAVAALEEALAHHEQRRDAVQPRANAPCRSGACAAGSASAARRGRRSTMRWRSSRSSALRAGPSARTRSSARVPIRRRVATRRADADRGARRGARCGGHDEQGGRASALREREDGRGEPDADLPQARRSLADRSRVAARAGHEGASRQYRRGLPDAATSSPLVASVA